MDEIEVPTEHLHEHINEKAHEGKDKWSMYVAISTALMAVFAALGSLFAGHHSNEAMIEQLKSSDQWAYYQAKGIKAEITQGMIMQSGLDGEAPHELKEKKERYKDEQEKIKEEAQEHEKESQLHLAKHVTLARSVTLFQIAIAISAISMLTSKKVLWYFSLLLSVAGAVMFGLGMF